MPASSASFLSSPAAVLSVLSVRTTTKALSLLFSPIFSSIFLTKLAKGSEVLRAKTQTTGAGPYRQR